LPLGEQFTPFPTCREIEPPVCTGRHVIDQLIAEVALGQGPPPFRGVEFPRSAPDIRTRCMSSARTWTGGALAKLPMTTVQGQLWSWSSRESSAMRTLLASDRSVSRCGTVRSRDRSVHAATVGRPASFSAGQKKARRDRAATRSRSWLGMIQHDMMLRDHDMAGPDGTVSAQQRLGLMPRRRWVRSQNLLGQASRSEVAPIGAAVAGATSDVGLSSSINQGALRASAPSRPSRARTTGCKRDARPARGPCYRSRAAG
jgi:hypothetical protein